MKHDLGTFYWITGLSGAGKSTIANEFRSLLQNQGKSVLLLDGDALRGVFGPNIGYSQEERKELGAKYGRLGQLLTNQGFDVICATISMYHSCHEWNRKYISNYKEIYLKVNMDTLKNRNQKKLYSDYQKGKIKNIVGIDIQHEIPLNPDLTIDNNGVRGPSIIAKDILNSFLED